MEKLTALLSAALWSLVLALPLHAASDSRLVSVPALGVRGEGLSGTVNYILIQFDRTPAQDGPVVQFNEINLGGGSRVGDEWKESVRQAVQAVAKTLGDEGRDWLITIKNRSMAAFTDGTSASGAIAVGIMAAYKGDAIGPDMALSGQITPDGRLGVVGGLPVKIDAAAAAHYRTVIVPRDQMLTPDWALSNDVAMRRRVQLIQVETLEEAYRVMTGGTR